MEYLKYNKIGDYYYNIYNENIDIVNINNENIIINIYM